MAYRFDCCAIDYSDDVDFLLTYGVAKKTSLEVAAPAGLIGLPVSLS